MQGDRPTACTPRGRLARAVSEVGRAMQPTFLAPPAGPESEPVGAPPLIGGPSHRRSLIGWPARVVPNVTADHTPPDPRTDREAILRLVTGYRITQALQVVVRLGIPDRLAAGAKTAEELARESGCHPDRLYRVLRQLAACDVFSEESDGRFALTRAGSLLRSDLPTSMAPLTLLHAESGYRAFADLLHTVRTGETAFDHVFGMGHFEYNARNPEAGATFNRAMAANRQASGDALRGFDLRPHHIVVDVGGGIGALLVTILKANPNLRGVVYDLPSLTGEARNHLAASGVSDRCEFRPGSAFESIPSGGDVYVMSRVLHDWPDDRALTILRNCRAVIPPAGVLLLKEIILPTGRIPPSVAGLDLMMMAMNGGRERTRAEWERLLGAAGFSLVRAPVSESNPDLIEARPV